MLRFFIDALAYLICGLMLLGFICSIFIGLFDAGMVLAYIFFALKGLLFHYHDITACGNFCPR